MDDPGDLPADVDPPGGPSIPRVLGAFAAGVAVTVVATVLFGIFTPFFLPCAPLIGAGVAGYLARVGRVGGALLGAVVMAAVGTAVLAGFWLLVTQNPPRTGGAGVGLVVAFLFLALVALFGVVLGGLGGLTGVVLRERRARPDDATVAGPATAGGRTADAARDPARPVHKRHGRAVDHTSPAADPVDHRVGTAGDVDGRTRARATTVLVGSGIAVGTCVVPLAPVAAGFAAGYLEADGPRRGAVTGGLAGGVATVLLVGGLVLFAFVPVNVFAPFIVEYLAELVVVLAVYFVGLSAAGGAFGASVAS